YRSPGAWRRDVSLKTQGGELVAPIQASICTGKILHSYFASQSLFDRQRSCQRRRRQKRNGGDRLMHRSQPIDAPGPLREPSWTPRQVVMHDPVCVLKIQAFAEQVGREQQVGF